MGYTHYYNTPKKIGKGEWFVLLDKIEKLKAALPGDYMKEVIRGGFGRDLPEFTEDRIWFNGNEEKDLDHETFLLERESEPGSWQEPDQFGYYFNFTKTARKPYDLLVCLVMIAMHYSIPCSLSTDGDPEDWDNALALYDSVFGTTTTYDRLFGEA